MRVRWLGWAGVEIEAAGEVLVIDPLSDPAATFAPLGDAARDIEMPDVVPAFAERSAAAGLVTHLHRDHADAAALERALRPGAPVLGPEEGGGEGLEELALAQARHELDAAGPRLETIAPWTERSVGPFRIVALPAVDGSGDPQVSWLIEAEGSRVMHLGDTMFHGFWWRVAHRYGPCDLVFAPVNGAVLDLPHRQPPSGLPAAMTPSEAATATAALRAKVAVPMHYGAYRFDPHYLPLEDAADEFARMVGERGIEPRLLAVGDALDLRNIVSTP